MANDLPASAPATAPPPATEAPSTPSAPASTAELTQLATPDNIDEYVAQRAIDSGEDQAAQEQSEPQRRMSKYQRLKAARDRAQAEAAELRGQVSAPPPAEAPPTDGAPDAGAQPAASHEEVLQDIEQRAHQHLREVQERAVYSDREKRIAQALPNYREVINNVADVEIPTHVAELIRRSEYGPLIAYGLGAHVEGLEQLFKLKSATPEEAARWVGWAEAQIEHGLRQSQRGAPAQPQPGRRVTQARPPVRPLRGGAAPSPSMNDLSNDMEAYARRRGLDKQR